MYHVQLVHCGGGDPVVVGAAVVDVLQLQVVVGDVVDDVDDVEVDVHLDFGSACVPLTHVVFVQSPIVVPQNNG